MAQTCIMLVAAEPSGDVLGAGLMRALRARLGADVRFVGVGGGMMQAEGLDSPFDIKDLAILGWAEGLKAYPKVVARADQTAALAAREKPDVAILIDSWGFTLRVGQRLRKLDPKLLLIKYVGPQVWAARPGRAKTLARTFDHLLSILGFDAPYFERYGLPVTKVGNPALSRTMHDADPRRARDSLGAGEDDPILLVLPGSRPSEVEHLMAPFGEAAALLKHIPPQSAHRSGGRPERGRGRCGPSLAMGLQTASGGRRGSQAGRHARRDGGPGLQRHGDHGVGHGRLSDGGGL